MTRNSRLLSVIVAGVAMSGTVTAQQSSSTIKGRITDAGSGANKAGVVITVSNPATGIIRTVKTDEKGFFIFPFIPVAQYQITYVFGGQTYKATRAAVLGQEIDASFKWPTTTGVTVEVVGTSAQAQAVDTATAQIGTTVTVDTLANLPMASRDINAAAVLAPGVAIVSGSNVDPTKKSSSYIMAGEGMGRGTNYAVDGADNNSTDVGGYVMAVPLDAVQELQVVTNQFKAEFGRSNQGFFNILTKSGTNEFAGIVSAQYQNQTMRARRTDELEKSDDSQNILAATLSGPIVKDKLFFMMSAEQTGGEGVAFDFGARPISIDPTLSSAKYKLTKKNIYAKIDWNPSMRMNTSWTYGFYQDETANQAFPRTTSFNGNVLSAALGTGKNKTWAIGGKLTFMVTDRLVWESNIHHFDYTNVIRPFSGGPGNGSTLAVIDDLPPQYGGSVPRNDPSLVGYGGNDPNAYQGTGIQRSQWRNDLSYQMGDHNLRGGMDFSRNTYPETTWFYPETGVGRVYVGPFGGAINYATAFNNILNADQNVYTARFVVNGLTPANKFDQWAFYLQDEWAVSPKLSVYVGARLDWDTQLDYLKQYDSMYAEIRANTLAASATADPAWNTGMAPRGKKYISPRFQMTYRPNGDDNFAFKFGAGQFVAQVIDNVTGFSRGLAARANGMPLRAANRAAWTYAGLGSPSSYGVNSFLQGSTIGMVNGNPIVLPADLTPYNYANNVNGLRDYFRITVDSWLTAATADTDGKSLLESDFQYPQTTTVNFGVSYRFTPKQAIEANVVWSKTKHMTVNIAGLDGAGPKTEEYDSNGDAIGDSIFYSNQQASSFQLQIKYTYSLENTNFLATLVIKDNKASEGGAAGAFDGQGSTGGLYGEGARLGFQENPLRRSAGTERYSGSFNVNHRFSWGTSLSFLGQWHSGRAYDVIAGASEDTYTPFEILGYEEGKWALNLDMRIGHKFQIGKKLSVEPYLSIQNILNNYDYGANYDGTKYFDNAMTQANDNFGKRFQSFQANSPRSGVLGVKVTF